MNQKRFVNILLVILVVIIFVGVGGYFVFVSRSKVTTNEIVNWNKIYHNDYGYEVKYGGNISIFSSVDCELNKFFTPSKLTFNVNLTDQKASWACEKQAPLEIHPIVPPIPTADIEKWARENRVMRSGMTGQYIMFAGGNAYRISDPNPSEPRIFIIAAPSISKTIFISYDSTLQWPELLLQTTFKFVD